jgi:hypothetical protein
MLRPLTIGDVDVLTVIDRQQADREPFLWWGFTGGGMRRRVQEDTAITSDGGNFAICADDGTLVGDVSWITRDW